MPRQEQNFRWLGVLVAKKRSETTESQKLPLPRLCRHVAYVLLRPVAAVWPTMAHQPPIDVDDESSDSDCSSASSSQSSTDCDDDPSQWGSLAPHLKKIDETLRCPVCKELCKTTLRGKCGHHFCSPCIRRFIRDYSKTCPQCRKVMNQTDLSSDPVLDTLIENFAACRSKLLELATANPSLFARVPNNVRESTPSGPGATKHSRMPTVPYHLTPEKKLREMVKKLGLPIQGRKQDLVALHSEYTLQHNIACDANEPIDPAEILRKTLERHRRTHPQGNSAASFFKAATKRRKQTARVSTTGASLAQKLIKQVESRQHHSRGSNDAGPEPDRYVRASPWRSVFSDRVGKPFYYNVDTKVGQFNIPSDLLDGATSAQRPARDAPYLICLAPDVTNDEDSSETASGTDLAAKEASSHPSPPSTHVKHDPHEHADNASRVSPTSPQSESDVATRSTLSDPATAAPTNTPNRVSTRNATTSKLSESVSAAPTDTSNRVSTTNAVATRASQKRKMTSAKKDSKAMRLQRRERKKWAREIEQVCGIALSYMVLLGISAFKFVVHAAFHCRCEQWVLIRPTTTSNNCARKIAVM